MNAQRKKERGGERERKKKNSHFTKI